MSVSDLEASLSREQKTEKTKGLLRWAALFLGELRDGLTMVRHSTRRSLNGRQSTTTLTCALRLICRAPFLL